MKLHLSKKHLLYIIGIYTVIQLVYVFFFPLPFTSDSLRYYNQAQDCLRLGSFYPGSHNRYDAFINAPIYVNYLILILKIFNSPTVVLLSNILLNLLQIYFLYKISKALFNNEMYSIIAVLIYVLYLTNLGAVLLNLTELMFGVFILGSFYFFLKNKNLDYIISGILLGLAVGVRQIGFALLLSYLTLYFISLKQGKANHKKMLFIALSVSCTILGIGLSIKSYYGQFLYTSDTGPQNLIIGANDDATGAFNDRVFNKGNIGYIENEATKTHREKGEFWKKQAIEWIKKKPFKWISLFPNKIIYMFIWDDWSIFTLMNTTDWNLVIIAKMIIKENKLGQVFKGENIYFKIYFVIIYILHHLYYFFILFLMVYQFNYYRKKNGKQWLDKFLGIYFFVFYGIGVTMIGIGGARYKYPYFIMMMITIVPLVVDFVRPKINKTPARQGFGV